MVLDYTITCAACSAPLTSPPRDGPDSMCAYLHTRQGRREFEATLARDVKRHNDATFDATFDATPTVTSSPNDETIFPEVTVSSREVTTNSSNDETHDETPPGLTSESRQQRYRRLNKDRLNQQQRDRRNHT